MRKSSCLEKLFRISFNFAVYWAIVSITAFYAIITLEAHRNVYGGWMSWIKLFFKGNDNSVFIINIRAVISDSENSQLFTPPFLLGFERKDEKPVNKKVAYMDFYLTAPDGSRFHFPINPEKITCSTGNRMLAFDVIEPGEISLPKGRVPTRFSFEGFFPGEARKDDTIVKSWRAPKNLIEQLSTWRDGGAKLRLLVTETPINHDVYFDGDGSFEHEWQGGHGDCWYSLRFVEARELVIRAEAPAIAVASASQPRPAPPTPKTYTVKSGDSLWAIAKRILGDGSRWQEIYNANVSVIGKNPNLIYPGQVLRIP